jgi:hypothetical protein
LDYLDRAKQYGETPWIPLETFRELMGIAEEMYPEFKKLNKWVITPTTSPDPWSLTHSLT